MEMKRRVNFRKGLDSHVGKLKKAIDVEKERRNTFISNHVQYLPSHFWPQLKEQVPLLTLDGVAKELDFPDFSKCVDIKIPENLFEGLGSDTAASSSF